MCPIDSDPKAVFIFGLGQFLDGEFRRRFFSLALQVGR